MRRFCCVGFALGSFVVQGGFASAQSSIDVLYQELNTAKQQHQDVSAQTSTNFFNQVDAAMGSPDAAASLYQQAGGPMPEPSPVVTQHESETVSEREARLALDQAAVSKLGVLLQLHCGLMHYAALFTLDPKKAGLQDEWVAWLEKAAQLYPQLANLPDPAPPDQAHKHRKDQDASGAAGGPPPPPPPQLNLPELKAKTMKDSIISKYLNFTGWGDGGQGGWSVKDLPGFYRTNVLEPLRAKPTAETLAAWDAYIAMANADEKDNDKWNQLENPPLQFDRACDDYAVTPSTEKLEALIKMASASPNFPGVKEWFDRIKTMLDDYKSKHGGASTPAPNTTAAPTGDPNTSVTQQQQGDMTIITTHTNSPPVNPSH